MPLDFTFSAAHTKISRAKKHLKELEEEVEIFLEAAKDRVSAVLTSKDGILGFAVTLNIDGPPESLGAIVGDVVHNLRSALDLSACELVRSAGQSDAGVYFPFSKKSEDLGQTIKNSHLDRAGQEAIDLILRLKPYHDGNKPLRLIHDLDIHDKHRALIPNVAAYASPIIQLWEDDGTVNPRIIGDPNSASEAFLIFPGEIGPQGQRLIPTLYELVELVENIVESFRALANRIK